MFPKIAPIIPIRRREIFESREWVYELKHDGFRALTYVGGDRCRLVSRRGNEMKRFGNLSAALAKELKVTDAVLDGEIVALNEAGMPAFYDLMRGNSNAAYYAFDVLWLNGRDLRDLPLVERKKILRSVIPRKSKWVGYVSFVDRHAMKLFELVMKQDLEGLVIKRKDGKYKPSQTLWYKVLNPHRKPADTNFFRETSGGGNRNRCGRIESMENSVQSCDCWLLDHLVRSRQHIRWYC